MKYVKIKNGVGDFDQFDAGELHKQLLVELGPQGDSWYLETTELVIHLVIRDNTLDVSGVDAVCQAHFLVDWKQFVKDREKHEKIIQKYQRKLAIQAAKADGKIPSDYPEE